MDVIEDLRRAHAAVVRAVTAAPGYPLPPDELRSALVFLASIGRALANDHLAGRLADLRAEVIADEVERKQNAMMPGRGAPLKCPA